MKKILSMVAVGASAVAAIADPINVTTTPFSVGVTAIESSTTNTIVSVSYADLGGNGDIAVSNIVKTTNLTEGDTLRVYNRANGKFKVFTLGADKFWHVTDVLSSDGTEESADPGATTLDAGLGLWLVRGSAWTGEAFTFYIYGKPTSVPSTSETAITIANNAPTLCGNCTGSAVLPKVDNIVKGDKIVIPYNNLTGTRQYNWNGSAWKVGSKTLSDIPPGTGFWYVPNGTGSARKLYW